LHHLSHYKAASPALHVTQAGLSWFRELLKEQLQQKRTRVNMTDRKVKLKDIANKLGVSSPTVSKALNNHPDISASTSEKIKKLAIEWNYFSEPLMNFNPQHKNYTIGVIVPDITTLFYPSIILGMEEVARINGYDIVIFSSQNSYHKEKECLFKILKLPLDGLLVCLAQDTAEYSHFNQIIDSKMPLVFFDRVCRTNEVSSVAIDFVEAAKQLTVHFSKQGATKIAYLDAPTLKSGSGDKIRGYKKGLQTCGLAFDEHLLVHAGKSADETALALNKLLSPNSLPDAIIGADDAVLYAAIQLIKKRKMKIPEQISLGGFISEFPADVLDPMLTAITYPHIEMGQHAIGLLLNEINAGKAKEVHQISMQAKLRECASTKQSVYKC
jgi:DNA-binding LacI/PurR family transcriptional regulator